MDRYRGLGIPAAPSAFAPQMTATLQKGGTQADVMLTSQTGFGIIRHTMGERSGLTPSSPTTDPFTIDLPVVISAATYADGRELGSKPLWLDDWSLLKRSSQQLKLCTDHLPLNLEGDGKSGEMRAAYLVDVMNPCWVYPKAEMDSVVRITAGVAKLPFNFQLGDDSKKIPLKTPETPAGELEVHLDGCDGPRIADMPLAPAAANDGSTTLSAPIAPVSGMHDLCFIFTRSKLDPIWAIDFVALPRPMGAHAGGN
jgi:hexosaminidase